MAIAGNVTPSVTSPALTGQVDYQAFWECRTDRGWLARVHEQLADWLRTRKDLDLDVTQQYAVRSTDGEARRLSVANHISGGRLFRAELVERTPNAGTWTTELIARELPDGGGWLSLVVRNSEGRYAAVPALARNLLAVLPLRDGALAPRPAALVLGVTDVESLVVSIRDPQRRGLIFVAGSNFEGLPFDPYVAQVSRWTNDVVGLAQVVVLDPAATAELAGRMPTLGAPAWTIRTYLPGVDEEAPEERRRHRIMGTASLAALSVGRVRAILGTVARSHASRRLQSEELTRVRRQFQRLRNQQLREVFELGEADVVAPEALPASDLALSTVEQELAAARTTLALVAEILGLGAVDAPSLSRLRARLNRGAASERAARELATRLDEVQTLAELREDDVRSLTQAYEDAQLDLWVSDEDNGSLRDEVRWLRARLRELEDYETAASALPDELRTTYPAGYSELDKDLRALEPDGIVLSVDRDAVLDLATYDQQEQCLRNVWDAAMMLRDYKRAVDAGDAAKGLKHYVEHTPSGYKGIAPGKFGATETDVTMAQYGHHRVFPVPTSVDPTGHATMKAHIKLARIGMISPRLYFLDDLANSGLIVIGYIGPHLPNTQTN